MKTIYDPTRGVRTANIHSKQPIKIHFCSARLRDDTDRQRCPDSTEQGRR